MRATTPRPCLLLFTRSPVREAATRPLLRRTRGPLESLLRHTCLERILAAGRKAGLRLLVSSPDPVPLAADARLLPQEGDCFAARLAGALERAFAEGYGPILVVPSDIPDLEPRHLRRALDLLAQDPDSVVLGPSPDGGIYLLGAGRALGATLRRVRWCRSDTRRCLEAELAATGRSVYCLEHPLVDLDRPRDLERWLAGALWSDPWRRLLAPLLEALAALRRPLAATSSVALPAAVLADHPSRAPPAPGFPS